MLSDSITDRFGRFDPAVLEANDEMWSLRRRAELAGRSIEDQRHHEEIAAKEREAQDAERRNRVPSWVPERIEGESAVDYWKRYGVAEFRAMLDGDLIPGRSTRVDMFGQSQWADPAGGKWG